MRIGLLTIHTAHNFGSAYQAYALQEYLKGMGHEVDIINYCPQYLSRYTLFSQLKVSCSVVKTLKSLLHFFADPCVKWRHYFGFKEYASKYFYRKGKAFSEIENIPGDYDAYIIGSDQVWNPDIMNYDSAFWGDFRHRKDAKVISYAASMDSRPLTDFEKKRYRQWLGFMTSVSVREEVMISLLQPLTSNTISWVIDPTLLIGALPFLSQASPVDNKSKYGKYVLLYNIIGTENIRQIADKVAEQYDAKVLTVKGFPSYDRHDDSYTLNNVSPRCFLSLIRDAEAVVSTSFHGTAFSILFHKDYFTSPMRQQGSRVMSLLKMLEMEDRIVTDIDNIPKGKTNYTAVDGLLDKQRLISRKFLERALYE